MTSLLLLLLACTPKDPAVVDSGSPDGGSSDGGTPDGGTPDELSAITWRVNETVGSVLHVSWQQPSAATSWLEFQIEGEEWRQSPPRDREAGLQEELILGVPYDTTILFRVVAGEETSEDQAATTDPLPAGAPVPSLLLAEPSAWGEEDRWLLLGISKSNDGFESAGFFKYILDRQGRIVWAHETPDGLRTMYMQPSQDGSELLWDQTTFWTTFDEGAASVVYRWKIDGTVLETIPTPGLHHTFRQMPDGTLAWGGFDGTDEVLRERAPDGSVRVVWNCSEYWAAMGSRMQCDGNAMTYNVDDDTWYYSSDNENTVVEIQRETGEVIRSFGQLAGSYAFSEGSGNFWKQHSPSRTPEGTLLISTHESQSSREMRAREYEIDDATRTLREVWSCGDGSGIEAPFMGEAHRLENGNTLLNYGGGGAIREVTRDCEVVWELHWGDRNMISRSVFLADLYAFAP